MEIGEFEFSDYNRKAEKVIGCIAAEHAGWDLLLGAMGTVAGIFIPGGGLPATGIAVAIQYPIYRRLAKELSHTYEPFKVIVTRQMFPDTKRDALLAGSSYTAMTGAGNFLAQTFLMEQLNEEFFLEILSESSAELAAGVASGFIPFIGGIFAAKLDVMIAITMTWRVGAMISAYFQNEGKWIGGSRQATYCAVKELTGGLSSKNTNRVNLDELSIKLKDVFETQVKSTMIYIRNGVLAVNGQLSREEVLKHLQGRGCLLQVAKEAIRRVWDQDDSLSQE
jgi:hypothetical protein